MDYEKPLDELISTILAEMEIEHFSTETRRQYRDVYSRLQRLAANRKEQFYSRALGQAFVGDFNYVWKKGVYSNHRFFFHKRCILLLERMIATGKIDWSKCPQSDAQPRSFDILFLDEIYTDYIQMIQDEGMKPSTICSYSRASYYFLKYLEEKRYQSLNDISPGDVTDFLLEMCKIHWDSKCLGSYISGLKKLLNMSDVSRLFIRELPSHMLRKREIIEVYSDKEHARLLSYLQHAEISKRNKAISLLAIETGMRAIDICNLKLTDVDWKNESIHLIQEKTGRVLDIPLRASYGNAMMDYLFEERSDSDSEFIFLQCRAPYGKLISHSCIFHILKVVVEDAGIDSKGRINGTRMMRHSAASHMVRKGIPLPAIATVLGHSDPNSTMTYISTDGEKLAKCTLPLPGGAHE